MKKKYWASLFMFFILSLIYMLPRIVILIAESVDIELPIRLTFICAYPPMIFLPPIIAGMYGKQIEDGLLTFLSCFLPIVFGEFLWSVYLETFNQPWSYFILLSFGLGLIGVSGTLKGKGKSRLCLSLGIILWILGTIEAAIAWFTILLGGPFPT
jgi:hypothetical protein